MCGVSLERRSCFSRKSLHSAGERFGSFEPRRMVIIGCSGAGGASKGGLREEG